MLVHRIGACAIVVIALAGCATAGGPDRVSAANTRDCKVVTVHSASEALRNQNARGVPGTEMQRVEGAADIGRVAAFPPRALRSPGGALDGRAAEVARAC